ALRGVVYKSILPCCPSSTCALQPLALVNLCLSFLPHANFVINGNCNKIVRYHDFISHSRYITPDQVTDTVFGLSQSQILRNPKLSKSDRSQVSDHCPDPTNVFGPTRYSIFTTRSVLYQDRSGRAYHQTKG